MTASTVSVFASEHSAADPSVGDFLELMKPRVMSLVVFTAFTGMVVAPGHMHPLLAVISLLAIAVGAGASGALNMWYAAGACPPMVGWGAATGGGSLESVLLFLIIFVWTPPHFWALALYRCRDYERVGVPMLPVVAGADETRRQILLYSLLLVPLAVTPVAIGLGGMAYGAVSVVLGAVFLFLAWQVWRVREGREADWAARRLFAFSIFYLFSLFAVLLAERLVSRLAA